jgi:hypothetical protein
LVPCRLEALKERPFKMPAGKKVVADDASAGGVDSSSARGLKRAGESQERPSASNDAKRGKVEESGQRAAPKAAKRRQADEDEADEEREDELRGLWQPYFQSRVFARHPPSPPFPLCMRFLRVCPFLSDFGHVSRFGEGASFRLSPFTPWLPWSASMRALSRWRTKSACSRPTA